MKKHINIATAAVGTLVFTALTGSLQALPSSIDGTISFAGTVTIDTSSLATATKFTSFQQVVVGAPSSLFGDYAGTSGATVTVTPFTWNPPGASVPLNPLWTFMSGGDTYSFNLSSLHVDFASAGALDLSGSGTAFITGPGTDKLPTTGQWSLTAQTFGVSTFTFSSTTTAGAPVRDGGTTAVLLGSCCLGFAFFRRRLAA